MSKGGGRVWFSLGRAHILSPAGLAGRDEPSRAANDLSYKSRAWLRGSIKVNWSTERKTTCRKGEGGGEKAEGRITRITPEGLPA